MAVYLVACAAEYDDGAFRPFEASTLVVADNASEARDAIDIRVELADGDKVTKE